MLLFASQAEDKEDLEFMFKVHEQYGRLVYHTAIKYLSDTREIEDLMQDCWEKLVKHVSTLKGLNDKALAAYIVCTVKNTAYNYKSYQSIRDRHASSAEVDEITVAGSVPSPEEMVLSAEHMQQFREALSRLSDSDRLLLDGKFELGMSDVELAEIFHCKPASIRMKLSRARRRATELLQEGDSLNE